MQSLQTNTFPLNVSLFEVEELEERLENKWGGSSSTKACLKTIAYPLQCTPGASVAPIQTYVVQPSSQPCPTVQIFSKVCDGTLVPVSIADPLELDEDVYGGGGGGGTEPGNTL